MSEVYITRSAWGDQEKHPTFPVVGGRRYEATSSKDDEGSTEEHAHTVERSETYCEETLLSSESAQHDQDPDPQNAGGRWQ